MSQIIDYKYDIFISYSHLDNEKFENNRGWVESFHKLLEMEFNHRRLKIAIWRDETRMEGNTMFDKAIEEAVSSSALFFALHSVNYQDSKYCRKELDWFHKHNSTEPRSLFLNNKTRLFNILLNNIKPDNWLNSLKGTAGFQMHESKDKDEFASFTHVGDLLFKKQVRKIADASSQDHK